VSIKCWFFSPPGRMSSVGLQIRKLWTFSKRLLL
jgi:hypothetical protein